MSTNNNDTQLFFNNTTSTVGVPRGTTLSFFPTTEKYGLTTENSNMMTTRKLYKPSVLAALKSKRLLRVEVEGVTFVAKMEVAEAMGENLFTRTQDNTITLPDHIRAEMFPPIFDYMRNKLIRPAAAVLRSAPMTPRQAVELDKMEEFIFGHSTKTLYQIRENEAVIALLPPCVHGCAANVLNHNDPTICLDPKFVELVLEKQEGRPPNSDIIADLDATYSVTITEIDLLLCTIVHIRRGRRFAIVSRQDTSFHVMDVMYDDDAGYCRSAESTLFVVA